MASIIRVDDLQDSGGNSYLSSNGSGTVTVGNSALKNTPAFHVYSSGNQTIGSGSWTKLTFDTELFDTDSAFASNKFTVPSGQGGKYLFTGNVTMQSGSGYYYDAKVYINGSSQDRSYRREYCGSGVTAITTSVCYIATLSASDYVEFYIQHNTGSDKNTYSANTFFSGYKLIGA
tara:strand:+ start:702 stop:1226 length:525 start_codon:yes stop_codon:yes gene_type:complete